MNDEFKEYPESALYMIGAIELVGQFNDVVADHAIAALAELPGKQQIWVVGERVHARLTDAGLCRC